MQSSVDISHRRNNDLVEFTELEGKILGQLGNTRLYMWTKPTVNSGEVKGVFFETKDINPDKWIAVTARDFSQYFGGQLAKSNVHFLSPDDRYVELGAGLGGLVEYALERTNQQVVVVDAFNYREGLTIIEQTIDCFAKQLHPQKLQRLNVLKDRMLKIIDNDRVCLFNKRAEDLKLDEIPADLFQLGTVFVDHMGVEYYCTFDEGWPLVEKLCNWLAKSETPIFASYHRFELSSLSDLS